MGITILSQGSSVLKGEITYIFVGFVLILWYTVIMKHMAGTVLFLFSLCFLCCLGGCSTEQSEDEAIKHPPQSIEFVRSKAIIAIGEKYQFGALVQPMSARQGVLYTCSNPNIATVTRAGIVEGVSCGSAIITACPVGFSDISTTTQIDVKDDIVLSVTEATLQIDESIDIKVFAGKTDVSKSTQWLLETPAGKEIVEMNSGTITGKKEGTVTLMAIYGTAQAYCYITVETIPSGTILPGSVAFSQREIVVLVGATTQLEYTLAPENITAGYQDVSFSSSESQVVTVDGQGNITALAIGSSVISATTKYNNLKDTCLVVVKEQ